MSLPDTDARPYDGFDIDTLFELLPAHLRVEDAAIGARLKAELGDVSAKPAEDFGPLRTFISIIAGETRRLEQGLDQFYDDHFIETCADWVAPYIGDLLGVRGAHDLGRNGLSARSLVANAIALRRSKGTAAALEEVASAVTLWPAVAVEFFQHLAITQSMRLPRTDHGTADLRDRVALRRIGGTFDSVARAVEVRRIATADGRWNLPNIGAFLYRTVAVTREWGAAAPVVAGGRQFFFHPLGMDHALWVPAQPDSTVIARRTIAHVPRPIDRADMRAAMDDYWPAALAVRVRAGAQVTDIDPATLRVCHLPDAPAPPDFRHSPSATLTRIDPVRGRLILADDVPMAAGDVVEVRYHDGAALDFGGGGYERADRIPATVAANDTPAAGPDDDVDAAVQAALTQAPGRLRIESNALHALAGGTVTIPDDSHVAIGAGNAFVTTLRLGQQLDIDSGGAVGTEVQLSGLVIAGASLRIGAGIRRLVLRDVTMVPGLDRQRDGAATQPAAPSLIVAADGCEVMIERSVLGPIQVEEDDIDIDITESVVVAASATDFALERLAGSDGGALSMDHATVVGRIAVTAMGEVSDSLLYARNPGGVATPPVNVERLQTGCVRFCWVPSDARVPRRYRCVPTGPTDLSVPAFHTLRWPDPYFARLAARTPSSITQGASDGGEIGLFGLLRQSAREVNLRERLAEFTPFGMEAGFFYES